MNEQTEKLIRDLADKLGTTSEHLWAVLVRQAPIEAATSLLGLLALLLATAICFIVGKKLIVYGAAHEDEDSAETALTTGIILCIISVVLTVCFCVDLFNMGMILSGFINPEYWALKQIIK